MARPKGDKKPKTPTLAETLTSSETLLKQAAEATSTPGAKGIEQLALTAAEVLDRWRSAGADRIFRDDGELTDYYRHSAEIYLVRLFVVGNKVLDELEDRMKNHEGDVKSLASALSTIGAQIGSFKQRAPAGPPSKTPETAAELEERLERARQRVAAARQGLLPAPTTQ